MTAEEFKESTKPTHRETLDARLIELDEKILNCKIMIQDCDSRYHLREYWSKLEQLKSSKHATELLLTMVK